MAGVFRYSVIVGNIGHVLHTNDLDEATEIYNDYVGMSELTTGRASGEDVVLMDNSSGEHVKYHYGWLGGDERKDRL